MEADGAGESASPSVSAGPAPTGVKSICHVYHPDGTGRVNFDRETVEKLLDSEKFFWLDIEKPVASDFEILTDVFKFHPLAVEDSENFGQRAKIEGYDDFTFIVIFGAAPDEDRLVEVHCFYSERFPRHSAPRRLPGLCRDSRAVQEARRTGRPSLAAALRDRRWSRRQLLSDPRGVRRPDRRARECDLHQGRRPPAPGDLRDEAPARRDAQGRHAAARRVREAHGLDRRASPASRMRTPTTSATSTTI